MDGQNQAFMSNVAGYMQRHSIIVSSSLSDDLDANRLGNGLITDFDLQPLRAPGSIQLQGNAIAVILTPLAARGKPTGSGIFNRTRAIPAKWLNGPNQSGRTQTALPAAGIDYVFTESLGGCSVYIQGNTIHHTQAKADAIPQGIPPNQQTSEPYPNSTDTCEQCCAVAYRTAGGWQIATSLPHKVGGYHRTHARSGLKFLGN